MKILLDIGHPAHVHLLRNLYYELLKKNHTVLVTVKSNLKSAIELLSIYNIPYISIGVKSDNMLLKALKQLVYDLKIAKIIIVNKIELGIGSSINLAHASKLTKMKSIILDDDDDEVQPLFSKYAHPFCDTLLSPIALIGHRKIKTIYYPSYHELAYLHPNRFKPDKRVLLEAGISEKDKYFVLRFNSFKAHHDIGVEGLSLINKRKLINLLKPHGKIFISTESEIENEFNEYRIFTQPHDIHSLLYYATMFIGDSQTMTSEAAVLGTPAIRSNSFVRRIAYLEEEENKYGLTYGFSPDETEQMFEKIEDLLNTVDLKEKWQNRRNRMLADKIDLTEFLVWFVDKYPESEKNMLEYPNYQFNIV